MPLPPARRGSVEHLLHTAALFVFPPQLSGWLTGERAHRAVGVVYHPRTEHWSTYVPTVLSRRYDAFCWFDATRALFPLHEVQPTGAELETYPDAE